MQIKFRCRGITQKKTYNKFVICFPSKFSERPRLRTAAQDGTETQNTTVSSSIIAIKTRKLIPTLLVINYFKFLGSKNS
jgi:hypothetical protein